MLRGILAMAVIALALVGGSARADAAGPAVTADVDSVATVTSQITVVFDFDLYDCPAGADIVILDWQAQQPSRPDSIAGSLAQPYGLSNGDSVQHLTLVTNSASFLAGERWVGSGSIMCGTVVIPVTGSGTTKSLNGV